MIQYLFFIFILFSSCSNKTIQNIKTRKPSSLHNSSCNERSKQKCEDINNLKIESKLYQPDYIYLNKINIQKVEYNKCYIDNLIKCLPKEKAKKLIIMRNNFKYDQQILDIKNNNLLGSFKNEIKYDELINLYQKIKKIYKVAKETLEKYKKDNYHGLGGSISLEASAGIATTFHNEFIIHNNKMAIFCAPAIKAKSFLDIPVLSASIEAAIIKTRGCKTNDDYRGKFLSFELNFPFGSASYSVGMDVSSFIRSFRKLQKQDPFFSSNLKNEIFEYKNSSLINLLPIPYSNKTNKSTYHLKLALIKKNLSTFKSDQFKNLKKYIDLLYINTNNCDATSIGLGPSISSLPISYSLSLYNYIDMTEINLLEVKEFINYYQGNNNLAVDRGIYLYNKFNKNISDLTLNNYLKCNKKAYNNLLKDSKIIFDIFKELF